MDRQAGVQRCLYNRIRDDAATPQAAGLATYKDPWGLALDCQTDQRGVQQGCVALVNDGLLVKVKARQFVPLDPVAERRWVVRQVAKRMRADLADIARMALLLQQGWSVERIAGTFRRTPWDVDTVRANLGALGFWNEDVARQAMIDAGEGHAIAP